MHAEDGFRRHLVSYRIDGFALDEIHHLTRARSTPRITVPNAAYGFAFEVQPSPPNGRYFQHWLPAEKTASLRPRLCIGRQGPQQSPFGSAPAVPDW